MGTTVPNIVTYHNNLAKNLSSIPLLFPEQGECLFRLLQTGFQRLGPP